MKQRPEQTRDREPAAQNVEARIEAGTVGLVERIQGDRGAFDRIYDVCLDSVYRSVRRRPRSRYGAELISATIVEAALVRLPEYREGTFFPMWLFRIARGVISCALPQAPPALSGSISSS